MKEWGGGGVPLPLGYVCQKNIYISGSGSAFQNGPDPRTFFLPASHQKIVNNVLSLLIRMIPVKRILRKINVSDPDSLNLDHDYCC